MNKERDGRLNLKQMVQNNLHETKYFNTTFIHPIAYYDSLQMTTKIKERRRSIDGQFNTILHRLHNELRDHNMHRMLNNARSTQTSRNQTKETKREPSKVASVKKPKFKEQEAQTKLISISLPDPPNKRLTIPRVKAMRASKQNERNFHKVPSMRNLNHYEHQKRLKEVLHQRTVLENMLAEHKQLQRDRENIAHEIQLMRNYLDNIRTRLNSSLRKLNEKYAINESHLSDGSGLKNKFYSRVNYLGKSS